jgi:hypothetical protein
LRRDDAEARWVGLGGAIVSLLVLGPLSRLRQRQLEQLGPEILAEHRVRQARGILPPPQAGGAGCVEVGDHVVGRLEGALAEGLDWLARLDLDGQVDDALSLADPEKLEVEGYISSSPPSAKP